MNKTKFYHKNGVANYVHVVDDATGVVLVAIKAKLKVNVLLIFSKYLVGAKYGQEGPQS